MYYGRNVDAFIYMGQAITATLPAFNADTYEEIPLLQRFTPPAESLQSASFNVLNDRNKRAVGGKLEDQFVEGTIVIDNLDEVVRDIRRDLKASGGQRRNWRIVYPDGFTQEFQGFLSQFSPEELDATADAEEHRAAFRLTVDGAITETYSGSGATA
jgi:hypothetical protein